MRVQKKGKIVDIPVKRGTVVKLRDGRSGNVTNQRGIVVGVVPSSAFSRAYGKQVYVCTIYGKKSRMTAVWEKGANDLYPVGSTKRIPKICREALADYKQRYGR